MSEPFSSGQSMPLDEATVVTDLHQPTEISKQSDLSSHPDVTISGTENTSLANIELTGGREISIGLSADDKHRLAKSIGYLVGRKLTYHRKIAKRAFGSQNIDPITRSAFISQLDTLVDAGILDRKHQRYAISPEANLISVDLDSLFVSSSDDTHQNQSTT
ncbi:hypothetical protein KC968_02680 [Candidatus Saccharibacteria bacterium]|nr:hypothetical protein [Candidatus Saccharibacteria bacterium]